MDRIESLKIFVRVAELQSFTQAAESLYLPKASVSTAIQRLERQLGTRLLHRTTRRVMLTPEGSAFYERSKDLLADVDELESMFRTDSAALRGKLRVDMTQGMAGNLVVPRLPEFLEAHPGLELELSSTDRRVDPIREGIDCLVRVGAQPEPGLQLRELGTLSMVNLVSPGYIARYGIPETIKDLAGHRLIHYVQQLGGKPEGFEYHDGSGYRCIAMEGPLTVNSTISYEAACLAGLGIIQAPLASMGKHLDSGALLEILPAYRAEPMPVKLIYPRRRLQVRRVRAFMDWLSELIADYRM